MRAVLLRRMMVLGVCAVGVSSLYLVPGVTANTRGGVPEPGANPPPPSSRNDSGDATLAIRPRNALPSIPQRSVSTPIEPGASQDTTPPSPVTDLAVRRADSDELRLAWAPGTDDTAVVRYRIWLNGYEIATTTETGATIPWFNDDSTQQVVVVRSVDGAGNQSRSGATLLLTRPEPPAEPATDAAPPKMKPRPHAQQTPTPKADTTR